MIKPKAKVSSMQFDDYRQLGAVNASLLKDILHSPKLAQYHLANPKDTKSLALGQGCHAAVYEPAKFKRGWVEWTGKIRRGKEWDEFKAAYSQRHIITADEMATIKAVKKAVKGHPIAGPIVSEKGKAEVTIEWVHPRTGLKCKSRLDKITSVIQDLKTTRSIIPGKFGNDFASYGYDTQLAFYADAAAVAGFRAKPVMVVAVETSPPHDVAVFEVPESVLQVGRFKYEAALDTLIQCRETGIWPGTAETKILKIILPVWAIPEIELNQTGESQNECSDHETK